MYSAKKILLCNILGVIIGLCGIVGGGILLPAMVVHAADSADGFVLPFPPTPSGSKAARTMQESTYSPLPEPRRPSHKGAEPRHEPDPWPIYASSIRTRT